MSCRWSVSTDRRSGRTGHDQTGAATAEAAVAAPVLLVLTMVLCWMLSLAVVQIRTTDAAQVAARAAARGDSLDAARQAGLQVAVTGTQIAIATSPTQVRVEARATVSGPAGMFSWLGSVVIRASAVAATEGGP